MQPRRWLPVILVFLMVMFLAGLRLASPGFQLKESLPQANRIHPSLANQGQFSPFLASGVQFSQSLSKSSLSH